MKNHCEPYNISPVESRSNVTNGRNDVALVKKSVDAQGKRRFATCKKRFEQPQKICEIEIDMSFFLKFS